MLGLEQVEILKVGIKNKCAKQSIIKILIQGA